MDNNDLGLIKYDLDIFKDFYNKNFELNEILLRKANELTVNYNCFMSNYDAKSLWEKKKMMAMRKTKINYNQNRTKPRVILIDFSDDMKCKKEFTSYLNKLTDVNKDIIYSKISSFINIIPLVNSSRIDDAASNKNREAHQRPDGLCHSWTSRSQRCTPGSHSFSE
jgi:hypothetical protein